MSLSILRPENRRRCSAEAVPWPDTRPACFRSEGFAEDLPGAPSLLTGSVMAAGVPSTAAPTAALAAAAGPTARMVLMRMRRLVRGPVAD